MGTEVAVAGALGAATAATGALVVEAFHLALRRRRNAALIRRGELPFKDEVFRPKWLLCGITGLAVGAVVSGLGASLAVATVGALALPALLAAGGVWFLRQ